MLFQAVASKIHVSCSHGILSFFGSTQWGKHGKPWRNHCHSNRFIGIRYMSLIWFKPKYNWVVHGCCLNSTGHNRPMQKWIKFTYARTPMNGWQNSKWNQIISNKYQIYNYNAWICMTSRGLRAQAASGCQTQIVCSSWLLTRSHQTSGLLTNSFSPKFGNLCFVHHFFFAQRFG